MSGLNVALPAVGSVAATSAVLAKAPDPSFGTAALAFTGASILSYLVLVVALIAVGTLLRVAARVRA